jgi:hypothetical protein
MKIPKGETVKAMPKERLNMFPTDIPVFLLCFLAHQLSLSEAV